MQVRRPVAVVLETPDPSEHLSPVDARARLEREAIGIEMPVEGEEPWPIAGLVSQDDGRSVVERHLIVAHRVHDPVQRSVDRRAGLHEQIDPQVHGPALWMLAVRSGKRVGEIDQACLVVPPDPYAGPPLGDQLEHGADRRCRSRMTIRIREVG